MKRVVLSIAAVSFLPLCLGAQGQATPYQQPPAPIAQMLDAEPLPFVALSPQRDALLLTYRHGLPGIEEVSARFLPLAGDRVNPRTNGSWYENAVKGLAVKRLDGRAEIAIAPPGAGRITGAIWSPNGANVAFFVRGDSAINLWVADAVTGRSRQLTRWNLNAAAGAPCSWATAVSLLCRMVIPNRGAAPMAPEVPVGPIIQEAAGSAAGNATYQDLLQNPTDEALFDFYYTSQIAIVGLDGSVTAIGTPGTYLVSRSSPDGQWILVQAAHRPYSYAVTKARFPTRTEIWSAGGRVAKTLADVPLQERGSWSQDAASTGLRAPMWRTDAPATIAWVEALDRGDPKTPAAKRDRVLLLAAPFSGEPQLLAETEYRFDGIIWGRDNLAILDESWSKTRRQRTWAIDPSKPGGAPRLLYDRSSEDSYANPGGFATTTGRFGQPVLFTTRDGAQAFLIGDGASPEGDRPFLDRFDVATGKSERLWRSAAPYFEQPIALLDAERVRFVSRREGMQEVPNYFVRDAKATSAVALTNFKDWAPQFAGVTKQMITYKRADGVQLSATMYLPSGYDKSQGPLPFLLWAYPQEFKSASAASQVTGSPYRFTRPAGMSHLFLLTQGYGVLDNPTMPIVGEGEKEPNDTYIPQLVASAKAAVDKIVELGVADRERVAVGGHSYGAFMTANLLAHSTLFKAGIARSGAYNRTLTPFGFQAEDRSYWEARDTYMEMSPFNYADKINAPILLIHGIADNNTGTYPIQSERFFAALKGHGKRAKLVMLPAEPHGYRARESLGHTLYEMVTWMDKYVKQARPRAN
jgi:dipeptidyl aminopeptidase/acylaminoacyl peptidase